MQYSLVGAAIAVAFLLPTVQAQEAVSTPSPTAVLGAMTTKGCFSSAGSLEDQGSYTFQSPGWCQKVCGAINKPVMATHQGSNCYCGDKIPSSSDKVSDSDCNSPCQGYGETMCGGEDEWSVSLTGLANVQVKDDDDDDDDENSSSSSSSAAEGTSSSRTVSASPSVITKAGQTIVVTASSAAETSGSSGGGGPSKAGIAAGVVAGVIGICAIIGGLFFFLRMRKRKSVEEAYRRNAAINSFVQGGKAGSEGSVADSRLDPSIVVQRRMSDGSIADNQDFSRRILKVTNPSDP